MSIDRTVGMGSRRMGQSQEEADPQDRPRELSEDACLTKLA
jgi:hypothetical protein